MRSANCARHAAASTLHVVTGVLDDICCSEDADDTKAMHKQAWCCREIAALAQKQAQKQSHVNTLPTHASKASASSAYRCHNAA